MMMRMMADPMHPYASTPSTALGSTTTTIPQRPNLDMKTASRLIDRLLNALEWVTVSAGVDLEGLAASAPNIISNPGTCQWGLTDDLNNTTSTATAFEEFCDLDALTSTTTTTTTDSFSTSPFAAPTPMTAEWDAMLMDLALPDDTPLNTNDLPTTALTWPGTTEDLFSADLMGWESGFSSVAESDGGSSRRASVDSCFDTTADFGSDLDPIFSDNGSSPSPLKMNVSTASKPRRASRPRRCSTISSSQQQQPYSRTLKSPKSHFCSYPNCHRSFTRKFNLTSHIQAAHSSVRPFTCPDCPATFARKHDLRRHGASLHTCGPHRFKCAGEGCGMTFARSDALKRHLEVEERRRGGGGAHCAATTTTTSDADAVCSEGKVAEAAEQDDWAALLEAV